MASAPDIVALVVVTVDKQRHAVATSQQLVGCSQSYTSLNVASIDNQARRTAIAAGKAGGRPAAGGGAAKPAKPMTQAQADADVLARARAAIAGGADPAAVAQRLRDRGYPGLAAKVYVAPVPDVE